MNLPRPLFHPLILTVLALVSACERPQPRTPASQGSSRTSVPPNMDDESSSTNAHDGSELREPTDEGAGARTDQLPILPDEAATETNSAKRVSSLPLKIKGDELFALDATPGDPSWAAPAKGAELSRDDDILTAWTCAPTEKRCALGLTFENASTTVHALRLFGSIGATLEEMRRFARVKKVRVHSGSGWVEADLEDYWDHQRLLFDEAVRTKHLIIEVLETFGGQEGLVGIAEVEVFGIKGQRRAPLELNLERVVFRGSPQWTRHRGGAMFEAFPVWIEELGEDGSARRLFRGSSLFPDKRGHVLFIERLTEIICPGSSISLKGRHLLVDLERRTLSTLGPFSGLWPIDLWVHPEKEHFARSYSHVDWRRSGPASMRCEWFQEKAGRISISRKNFPPEDHEGPERFLKNRGFVPCRYSSIPGPRFKRIQYAKAYELLADTYTPSKTEKRDSRDGFLEWLSVQLGERFIGVVVLDTCGVPIKSWLIDRDDRNAPIERSGGIGVRALSCGNMLINISREIYEIDQNDELHLLTQGALWGQDIESLCSEC